jgi:hypothetical protein
VKVKSERKFIGNWIRRDETSINHLRLVSSKVERVIVVKEKIELIRFVERLKVCLENQRDGKFLEG